MNNKYVNRSKISEKKFREIVRFFSLDLTAIQIAELTGLNRNTINRYLNEIRRKIAHFSESTSPLPLRLYSIEETINIDECCILLKEYEGKIYTAIAETNDADVLKSQYHQHFDLMINVNTGKHQFLGKKEGKNESTRKVLNRIESFWGNAKSRLSKFKGIHSSTYKYHLKECEFRYNYRQEDLYQLLLKILRNNPLF
ncbi:hypothetical protein [Rhodohalobacter sp. 8-1]|uniref:hypothetical protein n=1 Tax=Rhodohalobacter sp. 8-1 TaxID=3131972 RepID=UPI0030EEAEBB